ncbi:MAG TPA: hypothetical protein VKZ57_13870 [Sphingobacterium sp.]|nr:hypothetical protein [Sphingobacterium sp.]
MESNSIFFRLKNNTTIKADKANLLPKGLDYCVHNLVVTEDYREIKGCSFVQECVIDEKLTLISSDRKFEDYTAQKLKFVFNKR